MDLSNEVELAVLLDVGDHEADKGDAFWLGFGAHRERSSWWKSLGRESETDSQAGYTRNGRVVSAKEGAPGALPHPPHHVKTMLLLPS